MTMVGEPPRAANIVDRAKNILLHPSPEWDRIDAEPASIQGLFTGYAMILAAIGPVCMTVGMLLFGVGIPGVVMVRPSPVGLVVSGVVSYALGLVMTFVMGLIIDALAPSFDGTKDRLKAMKVAVYGSTAAWLAGVFGLIPMLGILGLAGLYSLFLVYRGLPKLMKAPQDKALGYTAVVVVVMIVAAILIGLITAPLRMLGAAGGAALVGAGAVSPGKVTIGGSTVDVAALQAASKQMEAQANAIQAQANGAAAGAAAGGAVQSVAPDALKALLPESVAGLPRTEASATSAGAGAVGGSHAEGVYQSGDARLELEVTDTGAMAGLAGLASAFNVNSSKDTATGYEKVSTVGGRMTTESYDRATKSGKYSVLAGGRFMIAAEGTNLSIDQVKAAVAALDPARVEALTPKR